MFKKCYLVIIFILLTACQDMGVQPTVEPTVTPKTETLESSTTLLVPKNSDLSSIQQQLSQQTVINQQLATRLDLLQQQYDELHEKVTKLQSNQTISDKDFSPSQHDVSSYDQAVILYQQKQYGDVIQTLQAYNSAGNVDENASKALWLMIQAHYHLKHCESVMTSVRQFNNRFPKDSNLANAWLLMADCQSKMQQKDIARETLRFIIRAYPDTLAAQQAKKQLNRK